MDLDSKIWMQSDSMIRISLFGTINSDRELFFNLLELRNLYFIYEVNKG